MFVWTAHKARLRATRALDGEIHDTKDIVADMLTEEETANLATACIAQLTLQTLCDRTGQQESHSQIS